MNIFVFPVLRLSLRVSLSFFLGQMAVTLALAPPDDLEQWHIKSLADYNVKDGSLDNTRAMYVGKEPVGFYVLHLNYIHYFHIFKAHRRRGYGRAAVAQLCTTHPALHLHSTPTARPFWERCGFGAKAGNGDESDRDCVEMFRHER